MKAHTLTVLRLDFLSFIFGEKGNTVKRCQTRRATGTWATTTSVILLSGFLIAGCEQSAQSMRNGDVVGLTWQWRYDEKNRLTAIEGPGNVTTRVTYTAPEAGSGKGRTSTVEFDGEKRTFGWNSQGRLVSARGSTGEILVNHNSAGLPTEIRFGDAPTIRYGYDVQDRLTETRIGDGAAIRYRYDYLGRLAAVATPAGEITYSYHRATKRVIRRLPNGVQTVREFDDEGKLVALTHVDPNHLVIASYAYSYRPDGLIAEITEKSQHIGEQICRYEYDLMQRLTGARCGERGPSHRYGYDSLGNLAESQRAGNLAIRFASSPAGALATDSRGETRTDARGHIRRLPGSTGTIDYTFNGAGELAGAVVNGEKVEYAYNALGLLTARRVDGRETRYLPDPFADAWHPLWQRDPDGSETVTVWDAAVPLVTLRGREVLFRLEDHLGSVRMEMDGSGRVTVWHDYTPYGAVETAKAGDDLSPGFAGLFWDPAARVYHAMARAFDPVTARFLQPDPQLRSPDGSKHSHSLYAYSGGDPVNFVDRNGAAPHQAMLTDGTGNAVSWLSPPALPTNSEISWGEIHGREFFDKRVDSYIDAWVKKHGEGPVDVFFAGVTMRFEEGEAYATERFGKGNRVIVIPSYESIGIFRYKLDLPKDPKQFGGWGWLPRTGEDTWKTIVDRIKPDRNLDLPHVWSRLEALECPVVVSYHESGALHDFLKNVPHIVKAAQEGLRTPYLVPTSGSPGIAATTTLRDAGIGVHDSVSHPNDFVQFIETPSFEFGYHAMGWDLRQRSGVADVTAGVLGVGQKIWSGVGYLDKEIYRNIGPITVGKVVTSRTLAIVSLIPGFRYDTQYHANKSLFSSLSEIHDQQHRKFEAAANQQPKNKSGRDSVLGFQTEETKSKPPRQQPRDELYDPTSKLPPPPPPPPPGGGGGGGVFPMTPSPVGGVYLGGASKALEGLGQLKGIAIDKATGKLALIGADEQEMALPPLRLDDVVTVFRAVYNHGRSPSVTIDPDGANPKGPTMNVKHGPGTEGTYVGWILFECDRVMKTYQLAKDNVTHQLLNSQVPGHAETVEVVFFGNAKSGTAGDSTWERFWIVPAAVRRFDAEKGDLSLFEVPLKVNTQKMKWKRETKNGKVTWTLVDDEAGESSVGATTFKNWFSDHYNEIADEVRRTPPPASGFKDPVAIFHELRRVALITAVAERLRDLGEPMPVWMRDYPVKPFPVPEKTPSLTVEKKRTDGSIVRTARIYGGVNLAPADADVRTFGVAKNESAKPASREDAAFVELSKDETAGLTSTIPELARVNAPAGTIQTLTTPQGKKLSVAMLPGAQTLALAPNRLEVADMVVPIGLGRSIGLTRYYHSFFDPVGAFGKGWTLNLPELLTTPVPVARDGKRSQYRSVEHLVNPLGTVDIQFDTKDAVQPYGIEMLVAKDHPGIAGVASGKSKIVGASTRQVLFRDGSEWHFDDAGRLLLVQAEGTATRYVRDSAGRVQQIVGYVGTGPMAEIRLKYDAQGRIAEAEANQTDALRKQAPAGVSKLNFEYDEDGRLRGVSRPESKGGSTPKVTWAYSYEADHLSKIGGAGRADTSFGYDVHGQLLWRNDGRKTQYAVTTNPQGTTFTSSAVEGGAQPEKWVYGERMRPLKADFGNGRVIQWRYGQGQERSETLSRDGKPLLTRSTSQDGRTESTALADGPSYEVRKDPTGRPTTLSINGMKAATLSWQGDGTLGGLRAGDTEIQLRRHENGWPNGLVISAPMVSGKTNEWLEEEWDVMGRPTKITESSGFEHRIGYDDRGRLRAFGNVTKNGKLIGANLAYNGDGMITGIESSWGREDREYGSGGILKRVERQRQGAKSVTSYDEYGRPTSHTAFDGGATTWRYESGDAGAAPKSIQLRQGDPVQRVRFHQDP